MSLNYAINWHYLDHTKNYDDDDDDDDDDAFSAAREIVRSVVVIDTFTNVTFGLLHSSVAWNWRDMTLFWVLF